MKKSLIYIIIFGLMPSISYSQCEELDSLWTDLFNYYQENSNDSIFNAKSINFKEKIDKEIHKTGLDSCKINYLGYYYQLLSNSSPLAAIDSLESLLLKIPKDVLFIRLVP